MPATPTQTLAADLLNRLDATIVDAEQQTKPLELEPYRSQLFELFVIADASGLMRDGSEPDLSPEGLSRELGNRWGLTTAAQASQQQLNKMSPEHLSKMRLLWSFLRMWMEWQYAWSRWVEFHDRPAVPHPATSAAE
ncbi:MAG: hypothetical protein DWI21_13655 [Planctomycetota bacterium]|nr:MAG: hypothetical protein DWI21_13655 [Planctomycetota bacterium]